MHKLIGILFFTSSVLNGVSDVQYRAERDQRQARLRDAQQELLGKQDARESLERVVGDSRARLALATKSLCEEQQAYADSCELYQCEINESNPELVLKRRATLLVQQKGGCDAALRKVQREHEQEKNNFDTKMNQYRQQEESLRQENENLQKSLDSDSRRLAEMRACMALFSMQTAQGNVALLDATNPPEYSAPASVGGQVLSSQHNDEKDAGTSYGAIPCTPLAPPDYDDVTQEEK